MTAHTESKPVLCPPSLVLDFETRSCADLPKVGSYLYASHHSTDILCCSFIYVGSDGDYSREWLWYPHDGRLPSDLVEILLTVTRVCAFQIDFDQRIYELIGVKKYGFPELPERTWYCLMTQCLVNALPGKMDLAAQALELPMRKDQKGERLIKELSIPQDDGTFLESPIKLRQMGEYAMTDSRVAVLIYLVTRQLTPEEEGEFWINRQINEYGVRINTELAGLCQEYASVEGEAVGMKLALLTNGTINKPTQGLRVAKLVAESLIQREKFALVEGMKKENYEKTKNYSCDANVREFLLANADQLTDLETEIIQTYALGSKASVKKFAKMQTMAGDDDRVRGAFIYAGASQTKRFSSKGLQLHNFTKNSFSPTETADVLERMRSGAPLDDPLNTLSKLLRPSLIPSPGHTFIVADWSAIEARIYPWVCDDPSADKIMEKFRNNEDVYVGDAQSINVKERTVGKILRLLGQYGGGLGAISPILSKAGYVFSKAERYEMITRWREANHYAPKNWAATTRAAKLAVAKPGEAFKVGRVHYLYDPSLMYGTLLCILPDRSVLSYPKCRREGEDLTSLKPSGRPKKGDPEWARMTMWHGILVENYSQAIGSCILREKLRDLVHGGIRVVAHVHDEVVIEVPIAEVEFYLSVVKEIMCRSPEWCDDLPLDCDPVVMECYGKH